MPLLKMNWSERYFEKLLVHKNKVYVVVAVLSLAAAVFSSKLKLKTDFATLLPQKLESVKNLNLASERIGGTGALLIGIESPSFSANKKFIDALADKLKALEGRNLRYVEYKYHESRDFLYRYGLHYLDDAQLSKFQTYLEKTIQKQKAQSIDSFLGLDEDSEKSLTDVEDDGGLEALNPQFKTLLKYPDAYLGSPDGKLLVMFARPLSSSLGVAKNREILSEIKNIISELNPKSFHPDLFVGFGGNVASSIDEVETVKADLLDTALLLVALIVGTLFLFLWSWKMIGLICSTLIIAVLWTFALTQIFIGYLNTQTAFLGSLVVGTGINYGVIFVSRYIENRRNQLAPLAALEAALRDTMLATLVASSTTAVAFVSLFLAQNKGLSQFGFIGSIGVVFTWLLTYTLLPLLLFEAEKKHNENFTKPHPFAKKLGPWTTQLGHSIVKQHKLILGLTVGLSLLSLVGTLKLFKDPLESNFDNLRNKVTKAAGVAAFEKKMQATLPTSRTPAPVLLNSLEEAKEICTAVEKIAEAQSPETKMIHQCVSLYKMLPPDIQWTSKREGLFKEIQKTLRSPLIKYSSESENLMGIRDYMKLNSPTVDDLPNEITVRFKEKNGEIGKIAFVSARPDKTLADSTHLFNFVDPLMSIPLASTGRTISATGDSFVLADLFRSVTHDGTLVATTSFISVILLAVFLAGGLKAGALMALCLCLGTLWLLGFQGFIGTKYNFFNFIALPLTFGIGIDYPINVFLRCRQEKFQNYAKVLMGSGVAVILCSLTTTIGYLTLVEATNQALVSFAKLALIGEVACLAVGIFVLPAILRVLGKFKN